jgi:hypothetical protein
MSSAADSSENKFAIVARGRSVACEILRKSTMSVARRKRYSTLRLSFDMFCALLEFAAELLSTTGIAVVWSDTSEEARLTEEMLDRIEESGFEVSDAVARRIQAATVDRLMKSDALFFNTHYDAVRIEVDFQAATNVVEIV